MLAPNNSPFLFFVHREDRGQMSPFIYFCSNSIVVRKSITFIKLFINRTWDIYMSDGIPFPSAMCQCNVADCSNKGATLYPINIKI